MKDDKFLSSSPDLHQKVPMRQPKDIDDSEDDEVTEDNRLHTHLFGKNFIMWFEIGIEGKSPMDKDEEDWGGTIEFGFSDNKFAKGVQSWKKYKNVRTRIFVRCKMSSKLR